MTIDLMTAPAWPAIQRLHRFKRGSESGRYTACCPAHGDRNPSLSIFLGEKRIVLTCYAGCEEEEIVATLGCEMRDLFPPEQQREKSGNGAKLTLKERIAATYDYQDERGHLLYQAVRLRDPKDFLQRRPPRAGDDPKTVRGGWVWKLQGVRRVPFRLPELLAADPTATVYLVEGEKDAERLRSLALVATTTVQGAKSLGQSADELAKALTGRRVVVVQDMDDAGDAYAAAVLKVLKPAAAAVAVLKLPRLSHTKEHGEDVSDWLDKHDGTVEDLHTLAEAALLTCSSENEQAHTSDEHLSGNGDDDQWDGGELLSEVTPEEIRWLWEGYIPRRKLTMGDGDPGLGKTMLYAADLAARVTKGRGMPDDSPGLGAPAGVVIFTAEDDPADTLLPRLTAAGGDPSKVIVVTTIFRPDPESGAMMERLPTFDDLDFIERKIRQVDAKLVIFDPYVAYLPPKKDNHRDQDVRSALAPLARRAQKLDVAMVLIRHLNRGNFSNALYRGMGSIGIVGASRSATLVVKDPDDENARIFGCYKHNVSKEMPDWRFRIVERQDGTPGIEWLGQSERRAQEILNLSTDRDTTSKLEAACEMLRDALAKGARPQEELETLAKEQGISNATLRRARKILNVTSKKVGFGDAGHWEWEIVARTGDSDDEDAQDDDEDAHTPSDEHLSRNADHKPAQQATSTKGAHSTGYEHVSTGDEHHSSNGHQPGIVISLSERMQQLNAQGIIGDDARKHIEREMAAGLLSKGGRLQ